MDFAFFVPEFFIDTKVLTHESQLLLTPSQSCAAAASQTSGPDRTGSATEGEKKSAFLKHMVMCSCIMALTSFRYGRICQSYKSLQTNANETDVYKDM